MESSATFKYIRRAPQKIRLVVNQVRGKKVDLALSLLTFQKKFAARDVIKLIRSAVANASAKPGVRPDHLYIKKIMVDQASILKRFMPRAKGSSSRIEKKLSHMTVVLDERI